MIHSTKRDQYWSFGCQGWSDLQNQEVFWGNCAVEASEVAEATKVNKAGDVFQARKIAIELSRILNSIIWASTNITIFWFFEKNLSIFSVWGLPMLLFWNFFDETQMLNIGKHAIYHECFLMLQNPTKIMIFNLSFCTETPCMRHKKNNVWTFDPINSLLVNFL